MSIGLALHDAAANCERQDAEAILTLRSGVTIEGRLRRTGALGGTVMVYTDTGWVTVLLDEIVAVESRKRLRSR